MIGLGFGINSIRWSRGSGGTPTPTPAVAGDLIGLSVLGGPQVTANPLAAPNLSGGFAALKFKDMGMRDDFVDPVTAPASLEITVRDAGFDGVDSPVTRTRVIKGTLPCKQPFPNSWAANTVYPPRSYVSSNTPAQIAAPTVQPANNEAYYTAAGGTSGATAPAAFGVAANNTPVVDGGVTWQRVPLSSFTGFLAAQDGADAVVIVALDDYIYETTEIVSVTIGAGVYRAGGVVSRGGSLSGAAVVNDSTLPLPPIAPGALSLPHMVMTGAASAAIETEWVATHGPGARLRLGQQIAGMRSRVVDINGAGLTGWVNAATSVISNQFNPTASPSGLAVECYRTVLDASAQAAGNLYVETEFFPWIGAPVRSREVGDGAYWAGSARVNEGNVRRNGANWYHCTTGGVTAASGGPTGTGTGIADGTAIWSYWGAEAVQLQGENLPARWHFRNDPGSLFKRGHAYVNTTGANIGTPIVHATEADARAAFPANSYGSIGLAAAALRTYHNTAGGGLTIHDDTAGGSIWLAGGIHLGFGVTSGTIPSGWAFVSVAKGPAEAPATIRTGANKVPPRMVRFAGPGLTLEGFDAVTPTTATNQLIVAGQDFATTPGMFIGALAMDGVTISQQAVAITTEIATGLGSMHYRNNTFVGQCMAGLNNQRGALCLFAGALADFSLGAGINTFIRIKRSNVHGCFLRAPPSTVSADQSPFNTLVGSSAGRLKPMWLQITNCDIRQSLNATSVTSLAVGSQAAGVADNPTEGLALSNVLGVVVGGRFASFSADIATYAPPAMYFINNSFLGERANYGYQDAEPIYVRNVYRIDGIDHVFNTTFDSTSHASAARVRDGKRCQNYAMVYAVGQSNMLNFGGATNGTAFDPQSYAGLRWPGLWNQLAPAAIAAQFVSYDAQIGGTAPITGDGDYRPAPGSIAITMRPGISNRFDQKGVTRPETGAVGPLEG